MTAGAGLRRFREPAPAAHGQRAGPRCELCAAGLESGHGHVVDLDGRGLLCVCRACRTVLTRPGAAGGRYRGVPDRHRYLRGFALGPAQWEALQLPVGMAFAFRNSQLDRYVVFYPSPGGATESLLPDGAWRQIMAAHPDVADLADDVEALLLRRRPDGAECHLVPIDTCYDLVGRVRLHWRGFDGGADVHRELDAFFAGLRARAGGPAPRGSTDG
ncbi:DUF5947 family protein [Streptomyces ochraceiscleroticus]|uniref:DUF5947 family protein n=1 Tax=Streptomyces ochraceiscleroticus TaxID=47761 RepID=A0ABW1MIL6_9ACTN|nr:DUF5947 family protein [Streptomyces ochraceiscleroticus]